MKTARKGVEVGQSYSLNPLTVRPALGGLPGGGEGQIPGFPSKNARSENRRKLFHRNGQRGYSGIDPEY
jgi:hypothetical protein